MKSYPLKIEPLYGDDRAYFSRGHQDFVEFMAEVRAGWEPEAKLSDPRHAWWRCVPDRPGADADTIMYPTAPGRGAFPVTVCCVD